MADTSIFWNVLVPSRTTDVERRLNTPPAQ